MKIKKYTIRILLILIPILCMLLPTNVSAMTQEQAGQYIANYAINFFNKQGDLTKYYSTGNYMETRGYSTRTGNPWPDTNQYMFDCMGFLSMVVRQSTGVIESDVETGDSSYIWPTRYGGNDKPHIIEKVQGSIQPGDLLANSHHVMIYVGGGKIIHCDGGHSERGGQKKGGLTYETMEQYASYWGECYTVAYRLTAEAVGDKTGNAGGTLDNISGTIGGWIDQIKGFFGELIGEDEEFPIGTPLSEEEYNKLYYKGIATLKGTSTTEQEPDEWVFPGLADITDWISGFLIMPVRAAITGWANIVQIGVSEYINAAAGGEVSNITEIMANMSEYMKNAITLEKIVYNQVPMFDVNVFSENNAGGETVDEDTLVATIRNLVANWYYVFRLIAIIGLLLILIYIGIKMAISTIAEEKAKYKELFINWLVAFVIVFFMQYFMIFVMQINQALIDIFKEIGKSLNLYETVRALTWEVKMTTGIIATALYVMLVYYMLKFVVMYFKRLFIVVILIILAPLIAAKYAIDKISGNKDSHSLKTWGQEYVFNVLMQSIHAFTYTIFTAVSVEIAKATTNTTSDVSYLFANIILVIVFFRFMSESEKILKQMMKLVTGPGADFGDTNSTSLNDLFGLTIFSQIMREMKPFYKIFNAFSKKLSNKVRISNNVKRPLNHFSNYIQDSYVLYNTERYKNRLKNLNEINFENINANNNFDIIGIGGQVDSLLREDLINRKELVKDYIGTGFNVALGMGKTFVGLPIFLAESPLVGAELMLVGLRTVRVAVGNPITGYRSPDKLNNKWYKSPVARGTYKTMTAIMSGGTVNIAHKVYERYKSENELRDMELSQVELLLKAQNIEESMKNNLNILRNSSFKGYKDNANSIENNLAKIHEKELIENIVDSQKGISETEIYNEVNDYKNKNGKYILGSEDVDKIINNLRNKQNNNDVKLTNKLNDNMKAELVTGIVNSIKGKNVNYYNLELSKKSLKYMSNNLRNKIEELESKENKTNEEIEQTNTLKIAYYMIKQKEMMNKDENEINELNDMANNMQKIIRESEENSKEDEIRKIVYDVLDKEKTKKENYYSKLGEVFEKNENEVKQRNNEELTQIKQKLKERLNEINNKENLDKEETIEKVATQKAYSIVQENIDMNKQNKNVKNNIKNIAEDILKNEENTNNKIDIGETEKNTNKIEDIVKSIEEGKTSIIFTEAINKNDQYKVNKTIIDTINEGVIENELTKLSNENITKLIKKSTNIHGSIEKKEVPNKYKDIIKDAERLRDLNEESEIKYGKKIYTTQELIDGIKKGIRGKEKE